MLRFIAGLLIMRIVVFINGNLVALMNSGMVHCTFPPEIVTAHLRPLHVKVRGSLDILTRGIRMDPQFAACEWINTNHILPMCPTYPQLHAIDAWIQDLVEEHNHERCTLARQTQIQEQLVTASLNHLVAGYVAHTKQSPVDVEWLLAHRKQ